MCFFVCLLILYASMHICVTTNLLSVVASYVFNLSQHPFAFVFYRFLDCFCSLQRPHTAGFSHHAHCSLSLLSVVTFRSTNLIVERSTQQWFSLKFERYCNAAVCINCLFAGPAAEYATCLHSPQK